MVKRQSAPTEPVKVLPTKRVLADPQLTILRAACSTTGTFTARDLEAATGIPAQRAGLVMGFLVACDLVQRAPGRGVYRRTKKAITPARAWRAGEEQGRRAIRDAWKTSWFALSAHSRLSRGPGLRAGLVTKLMTLAQAGQGRRLEVEMLVDLMVATGMLIPEKDGFLRWYENPAERQPCDAHPHGYGEEPALAKADQGGPRAPAAGVPPPRTQLDDPAVGLDADLVTLLSPPVLLADLARLSAEDLIALHGHIRGLAVIVAKLRSRPMT